MPQTLLERTTHSLAHRGLDDYGTAIIRDDAPEPLELGLGVHRLAILDLSLLGHQPMHDPTTGNWIVHNGEIYNFREIREKLEKEGVRFVSHSDTEVLLKAYGQWGEKCLFYLRGMFAFAIWDARRHRLFLARDPVGIKPLYYSVSDKYFLFASEVRTLLATGLIPRNLDHAGIINYLTFGSVYDPTTLIEGVAALRPGHFLTWQNGVLREQEYCDLVEEPFQASTSSGTHSSQSSDLFRESLYAELAEAVRLQLRSDVPVGVFLSGGIDSSSIVALSSANGVRPSTFSIVFREAEFNEGEFSRAIAHKFGTDHHEILISQTDALEAIPEALPAMDQPSIDGLNTYLISRHARAAGVKVALSGLGGDEIFAGYSSFLMALRAERFSNFWHHVPGAARRTLAGVFSLLTPETDRNRKLFALAYENGNLLHPYFLLRMLFTPHARNMLFPSASPKDRQRASATLRETLDRAEPLDAVNRMSYLEARCYMLNTLLRDADCMSMANGLELRVPLLDHQVAKKIISLPGARKLNRRVPKPLLVEALGNALPDHIVRRPKRGFTLPFEHWLRDELRPTVADTLRKIQTGPLSSILDGQEVDKVWQDFLEGRSSWSRPWSLYMLERWSELHLS